jgi:hypothetical protein
MGKTMSFTLDEAESKKINDWMLTHKAVYEGASGGRYSYMFQETFRSLLLR